MKQKAPETYVQMDDMEWAPFPEAFCDGPIKWRLLNTSPEMGSWTAVFDCPAGTSFAAHFHTGPGEYFLYEGKMDIRGGVENGGDSAFAPGYGYESSGARHDQTSFPIDSKFYMTFLGPLAFINPDGSVIANVGWQEAEAAWDAFLQSR
ncbi:hypothetical protein [Neptuniibacter sp. CAU 1671]|uniref:cupin domain-containing protein n=1 Tax=Neptuniibacter sp. CAU 1671 TaxID=3032593 RepID=UPI0023DBBFF3|nr:hypothetical protein [Neptuniibacter sp. CAU 1671]MDF2180574.1 hypothetical protein [Neptuniibacter sp. CAU 1671]